MNFGVTVNLSVFYGGMCFYFLVPSKMKVYVYVDMMTLMNEMWLPAILLFLFHYIILCLLVNFS